MVLRTKDLHRNETTMIYLLCVVIGIVLGLIGGILLCRRKSGSHTGETAPISPEQYEKIKAVLKHIEEGDEILKWLDELLKGKE